MPGYGFDPRPSVCYQDLLHIRISMLGIYRIGSLFHLRLVLAPKCIQFRILPEINWIVVSVHPYLLYRITDGRSVRIVLRQIIEIICGNIFIQVHSLNTAYRSLSSIQNRGICISLGDLHFSQSIRFSNLIPIVSRCRCLIGEFQLDSQMNTSFFIWIIVKQSGYLISCCAISVVPCLFHRQIDVSQSPVRNHRKLFAGNRFCSIGHLISVVIIFGYDLLYIRIFRIYRFTLVYIMSLLIFIIIVYCIAVPQRGFNYINLLRPNVIQGDIAIPDPIRQSHASNLYVIRNLICGKRYRTPVKRIAVVNPVLTHHDTVTVSRAVFHDGFIIILFIPGCLIDREKALSIGIFQQIIIILTAIRIVFSQSFYEHFPWTAVRITGYLIQFRNCILII